MRAPLANSLAYPPLTLTFEANNLANSGVSTGGLNLRFMGGISHMAKLSATSFFANGGGTMGGEVLHTSHMAKRQKIQWYAREWRKKKELTLEAAAERLDGMALSYLSDLEKGKARWNSDHLEAFAFAYGIDPEDLLWNPNAPPPLWVVINKIAPADRDNAAKALAGFMKKTGTDG